MAEKSLRFDTLQVRAGQTYDPTTGAVAVPIYMTNAYQFESAQHAADLFDLKVPGNIYTRLGNPTSAAFEERINALESGVGALATSSGHAAVVLALQNIVFAGDNIVSASTLYGGTYNLFSSTFPKYGITVKMVDPDDPQNFADAIDERTKALYIETIGNPGINLIDIEAVAKIAHDNGIPLIADTTFTTPYLLRAFDHGVDISICSATKFLGGHGTCMGGVITDSGKFDWTASGKFDCLSKPDPSYHDIVYTEACGAAAYITKARVQLMRDLGGCPSPFNSFLFLQGLETLSLRMRQHVDNTRKIVEFLSNHPAVAWVNYPELEGNKYHELAKKYLPKGAGSIFTFGIKGGVEAGIKFIENVALFYHVANLADARSLVTHPASTTHSQLDEAAQKAAGVTPDMIRLSVGIEDAQDLIDDLDRALSL